MKRIIFVVLALAFAAFAYYGCISDEPNSPSENTLGIGANTPPPDHPQKVKLCHVPPGNPENAHVIEISEKGLAAHLAHGDCYAPEDSSPGDSCTCETNPDPECEGATCLTFIPCNEPNLCIQPVCMTTAEGGGLCVEGQTPCAGLPPCPNGTGDCPPGWICGVETCCGGPVCIPPAAFCPSSASGIPIAERIVLPPDYTGPRVSELGTVIIERRK